MSGIQLSSQLIDDMKAAIAKHDASANDNMTAVQYMAAAIGYVISEYPEGQFDKTDVMQQLADFTKYVYDQMEHDKMMKPSQEEAFGKWRPGE